MKGFALPISPGDGDDQRGIVGLGTAALGRPAYMTTNHGQDLDGKISIEQMRTHAGTMFDLAYDRGVRYFDAARSYGLAEQFLADWIGDRNPEGIFVASKWGQEYVADWDMEAEVQETKDHSIEAFRRQVEESRQILGEHLNLYQVHSITPSSPVLTDQELHSELAGLKADGIRVGFSSSGPDQAEVLERAGAIAVDGVQLFDAAQVTWNPLDQSAAPQLQALSDAGVVVIIKEALANGRLGPDGDRVPLAGLPTGPADTVALAAALNQSFADVVLSGAVTAGQLESNLAANSFDWDQSIRLDMAIDPKSYWEQRGERPWT